MLRRLFIRDFVIADRLELEFGAGFSALTGETGAGKSILVDALGLALGGRAEAGMVRAGAERAEVSAEFDIPPGDAVADWLAGNDLAAEEGRVLLRRVVEAGGRSRAYVNGTPATVQQLADLGDRLADIHGQHAHHALLRPEAQRALLDGHAGALDAAARVAAGFREWRRLRAAREQADAGAEAALREKELAEWQVAELRALAFDPEGWRETEADHRRLSNAADLLGAVEEVLGLLEEAEDSAGARTGRASARLADAAGMDPALEEARALVEGADLQLREAVHGLRRYRDQADLDPSRLGELEARIEAVMAMARKHRVAPEELPETLAALESRLQELALLHDPAALAAREEEARRTYLEAAGKLTQARRKAAAALEKAVTAAMGDLAMGGGRFAVHLEPVEEGSAHGQESVEFRVSANPGQPLRALAKVASGGELSRIGLALQVIASRAGGAGTLVFDEVDVGIGGRVAEIVGRMLAELGRERQVLCVTHLPQVAARADAQFSIAKENRGGGAFSVVIPLDGEGRVDEIARMLGGVKITETTREHAREMLGSKSTGA